MSAIDHEVAVEIGSTPVVLRTEDAAFRSLIEERYSGFMRRSGAAPFAFDVAVRPAGEIVTDREDLAVEQRAAVGTSNEAIFMPNGIRHAAVEPSYRR